MKSRFSPGATLTALVSGHTLANEPLTLVLDWYVTPTMRRLWWPSRSAPLQARGWTSDCPPLRSRAASPHGGRLPGGSGHHLPAAGALLR